MMASPFGKRDARPARGAGAFLNAPAPGGRVGRVSRVPRDTSARVPRGGFIR